MDGIHETLQELFVSRQHGSRFALTLTQYPTC